MACRTYFTDWMDYRLADFVYQENTQTLAMASSHYWRNTRGYFSNANP